MEAGPALLCSAPRPTMSPPAVPSAAAPQQVLPLSSLRLPFNEHRLLATQLLATQYQCAGRPSSPSWWPATPMPAPPWRR